MRLQHPFILFLGLFSSLTTALGRNTKDRILLSKVRSLTLRANAETSHRRVSAIPQLSCVGGNAKGLYEVDVLRCRNAGSEYDSEDVQWTCQGSLPAEFKLGSTEVICEGYDSPEDPYVLKGSCGVEYRLVLTEAGEEKYGNSPWDRARRQPANAIFGFLFWAAFLSIAGFIIYKIFRPGPGGNQAVRRPNNFGGGYGGGGYPPDDNDDAPPPYTPRAPKASSAYSYGTNQPSGARWQPGFWTGTAAGAAAGYMAANRGGRRDQFRGGAQAGPSNWFGGGGGRASGGGLRSAPAPSSSRYESTGFGGTSRR